MFSIQYGEHSICGFLHEHKRILKLYTLLITSVNMPGLLGNLIKKVKYDLCHLLKMIYNINGSIQGYTKFILKHYSLWTTSVSIPQLL